MGPWEQTRSKIGSLLGLNVSSVYSFLYLCWHNFILISTEMHSWNAVFRPGLCILKGHVKIAQRRAIGMIKELKKKIRPVRRY